MTALDDARRWTIRHFQEFGVPDDETRAAVLAILRDQIRREGFVLDDDTLRREDVTAIRVIPGGFKPHTGGGNPDGWIAEWSVGARLPITDDVSAEALGPTPEGAWAFAVPLAMTAEGGGLRVVHNLNGEVTVQALREDGSGIGYHFAQPISDDEVHVELVPGAVTLIVTRDEDDPV